MKDRRILYELDNDCRQSNSQIAKKVGLSHDTVNYRIKRLEETGVIEGYFSVIDLSRIGQYFIRGWLNFHNISPDEEKKLIEYMLKTKKFGFICTLGGRYDFGFSVNSDSLIKYAKIIDDLYGRFSHMFKYYHMSIASRIFFFQNSFIYPSDIKSPSYTVIGEQSKCASIDKYEEDILGIMSGNARISIVDLSKKAKITAGTAVKKLTTLKNKKVLLSHRAKLNFSRLGFQYYKLFLVIKNLNAMKLNELVSYGNYHKNIIYLVKVNDHAQIEYELIVRSSKEYFAVLKEIKYRFRDIIMDHYEEETDEEFTSVYLTA